MAPFSGLDAGDNYMIVDYTGPSPITSLQSGLVHFPRYANGNFSVVQCNAIE